MKITCPECTERFDISSDMVGKKAKCGSCSHVFVVPEVKESKAKKLSDEEEVVDVRETAWLSLYLAGLAVLLLLFRAQQGGIIAVMLLLLPSNRQPFSWHGEDSAQSGRTKTPWKPSTW